MPANYNLAVKTDRMAVVLAAIDAAAPLPARLIIRDTYGAGTNLVSIPLAIPSFDQNGDILILRGTPLSALPMAAGPAMMARIVDGVDNIIVDGLTLNTTITADPDIIMTSLYITMGEQVRINSGTITHG